MNYPETKTVDTVDTYFDIAVKDPYRWLEDDRSADTEAWVEAQNNATFWYLENIPYREELKKRLSKLSLIVDSNGIPLSALLVKGNKHDLKIMDINLNNLFISIKPSRIQSNNKHKRYLLADAIYHSHKTNDEMRQMNITPIIAQKKNSKTKLNRKQKQKKTIKNKN